MTLPELNALDADEAARALLACCGSTRWARAMADARPFASVDAACDASDAIWSALDRADWLEAFRAHPRIGERKPEHTATIGTARAARAGARTSGIETRWSADEQSGVEDESRSRLQALNRAYEERFGHIFIICAAGKSGGEMLRALERRIGNNPENELHEAAEEQRAIARLRLAKLLT
jgi:OHCU decarboxylase